MTRRPIAIAAIIAGVGVACSLVFWLPRSQITRKAAERIQLGMTVEEVEAILGPVRDESGEHLFRFLHKGFPESRRDWVSRQAAIMVMFDSTTNRVTDVCCEKPTLLFPTPIEEIQDWLETRWDRLWP